MVTILSDQDEDLDFPKVTREELLDRCEKELNFSNKQFNRTFSHNNAGLNETKNDEEIEDTIRIFQWNVLSQSKVISFN